MGEGVRMQRRRWRVTCFPNAEVNEASIKMSSVHPFSYSRIVTVWYQEGQAEITQKTLGSAFPISFFRSYLNQFTGERHICLRQIKRRRDRLPHCDLSLINICTAAF